MLQVLSRHSHVMQRLVARWLFLLTWFEACPGEGGAVSVAEEREAEGCRAFGEQRELGFILGWLQVSVKAGQGRRLA